MYQKEKSLVEEHLYLVKNIILSSYYFNDSIEGLGYEDMYQTGCEALCYAAMHYRNDRNASFKTYAKLVINSRLKSHCRKINRLQANLEYLYAPIKDTPDLTYADVLTAEDSENLSETDILAVLSCAAYAYSGICRKGIEALKLKCQGYQTKDIALQYGVKPKLVSAWISRAGSRLRADKRFDCFQ